MQTISLVDTISVCIRKDSDKWRISGNLPCPAERSTIWKALEVFFGSQKQVPGIDVLVQKSIPHQTGLGGASSDAAATLKCLQALFEGPDDDVLFSMASRIGSDVSFFMAGGAAIAGGTGEVIAPIPSRTDFSILVAVPSRRMDTARAYRLFDAKETHLETSTPCSRIDLEQHYRENIELWRFSNSFVDIVPEVYPEILAGLNILNDHGAAFASMSGSGTAIFGLFNKDAPLPLDQFDYAEWQVFSALPLARPSEES